MLPLDFLGQRDRWPIPQTVDQGVESLPWSQFYTTTSPIPLFNSRAPPAPCPLMEEPLLGRDPWPKVRPKPSSSHEHSSLTHGADTIQGRLQLLVGGVTGHEFQ